MGRTSISIEVRYEQDGHCKEHRLAITDENSPIDDRNVDIGIAIAEFLGDSPVDPVLTLSYAMSEAIKSYPDERIYETEQVVNDLNESLLKLRRMLYELKGRP